MYFAASSPNGNKVQCLTLHLFAHKQDTQRHRTIFIDITPSLFFSKSICGILHLCKLNQVSSLLEYYTNSVPCFCFLLCYVGKLCALALHGMHDFGEWMLTV